MLLINIFAPNFSDRSKLKAYTVPSIDTIKRKLNVSEKDNFLSENDLQNDSQNGSVGTNLICKTDFRSHFGNESPPSRLPDLIFHDFGASETYVS